MSTDAQAERNSPAVQRVEAARLRTAARLARCARIRGSGHQRAALPKDRPALSQLLKVIQRGAVDVVLVAVLERIVRTTRLILELVERFGKHGVNLLSCIEQFDVTTASRRYRLTLLVARVHLEYETTLALTTDGRNERSRRDGKKVGIGR